MRKARLLYSLLLLHSSLEAYTTTTDALDSSFPRQLYSIRPVTSTSVAKDAPELSKLLKTSVQTLGAPQGYTERQVQAWYDRLCTATQITQRVQEKHRRTWVAVSTQLTCDDSDPFLPRGSILGVIQCVLPDPFVSTAATFHYLDLLYVHPQAARQGIGAALVEHVLSSASTTASTAHRGWWVEASPAARRLLEGKGFVVQTRQRVWLEEALSMPHPRSERGDVGQDTSLRDQNPDEDVDRVDGRLCLYNYRMVRPPFYATME